MKYNEFVEHILFGGEVIGTIDNLTFKILNVIEDKVVFFLDNKVYEIDDEQILVEKVYKDYTFKDLFEKDMIKINELY